MMKYIFTPRLNQFDMLSVTVIAVLCWSHSWFWLLLSFPLGVVSQTIQNKLRIS